MRVRGRLTTIPDDLPVPDGTQGQIRLLDGDTLIATVDTTDGWYFYEQNGNPGPFRIFWDYADVVSNQYSKITGPSAATDIAGLPLLFRAWDDGVIPDVGNDIVINAFGGSMSVTVQTGAAVVRGVLYDQNSAAGVDIPAADPTNPRIDTIAIQIVPAGAGEDIEGRAEIVVVEGTPAASPVAPSLTQTNDLWEHPLADVLVGAGVTVIGSDKVTDRRVFSGFEIGDGEVTTSKLADGAVTASKLADGVGVNILSYEPTLLNNWEPYTGTVPSVVQVGDLVSVKIILLDDTGQTAFGNSVVNLPNPHSFSEYFVVPKNTTGTGVKSFCTFRLSENGNFTVNDNDLTSDDRVYIDISYRAAESV